MENKDIVIDEFASFLIPKSNITAEEEAQNILIALHKIEDKNKSGKIGAASCIQLELSCIRLALVAYAKIKVEKAIKETIIAIEKEICP